MLTMCSFLRSVCKMLIFLNGCHRSAFLTSSSVLLTLLLTVSRPAETFLEKVCTGKWQR